MFQGRENVYNTLVAKKSRKGSSKYPQVSLEVSYKQRLSSNKAKYLIMISSCWSSFMFIFVAVC